MKLNKNFQYHCEITYDTYYECHTGSSCCDNDYCRCGVIQNAEIKETPEISSIVKLFGNKLKEIDKYCIDRILTINNVWDPDKYDICIRPGYYGEEIDFVKLKNAEKIEEKTEKVLRLKTNAAKIKAILIEEYDFFINCLEGKRFKITNIKKSEIKSKPHKLDKKMFEIYEDYDLPRGICIKKGEFYELIDGFHRVASATKENIKIILGH